MTHEATHSSSVASVSPLVLHLQDREWPDRGITHERQIARAIIWDDDGKLLFVRIQRNDEFGPASVIETSGGGIEPGESPEEAVLRELREELGAEAQIYCKLGLVYDSYNLIQRRNCSHYFLCHALAFGPTHQTEQERNHFHLTRIRTGVGEVLRLYEENQTTSLGRLLTNRELPMLMRAIEILEAEGVQLCP